MAKNIGIIRFTGKLGGLSGRDTAFGNIIQTPGGFKSERLKNDPIYLKSRQLSTEFGRCSKIAALFRQLLLPYLKFIPDPYVYNHIQKCMLAVKDCDLTSPHGSKTVTNGLQTPAGATLLGNFSFNRKRHFYFTGIGDYSFDLNQGQLILGKVDTTRFDFPTSADAIGFQLMLLCADFETPTMVMEVSEHFILRKNDLPQAVILKADKPTGKGSLIAILLIGCCSTDGMEFSWKKHDTNLLQVIGLG